MESDKVFDYKEFLRWWKQYQEDEIEESKRRDEITKSAELVLLASEKLVRDWKESYIQRGMKENTIDLIDILE